MAESSGAERKVSVRNYFRGILKKDRDNLLSVLRVLKKHELGATITGSSTVPCDVSRYGNVEYPGYCDIDVVVQGPLSNFFESLLDIRKKQGVHMLPVQYSPLGDERYVHNPIEARSSFSFNGTYLDLCFTRLPETLLVFSGNDVPILNVTSIDSLETRYSSRLPSDIASLHLRNSHDKGEVFADLTCCLAFGVKQHN